MTPFFICFWGQGIHWNSYCRTPVRLLITALVYNSVYRGLTVGSLSQFCAVMIAPPPPLSVDSGLANNHRFIIITLVTISLETYEILPPEAATVCCGQRPQHSWITESLSAAWGRYSCLWPKDTRINMSHLSQLNPGQMVTLLITYKTCFNRSRFLS